MLANGLTAFGIAIEFLGFVLLAVELIQTNLSNLREAKELATARADEGDVGAIVGFRPTPGKKGHLDMKDGLIGKLIDSVPRRKDDLTRSKKLIYVGVGCAALGSFLQFVGAVIQVWDACPCLPNPS